MGWRDLPEVRAAAEARIEVARRCGMRPLVERLQYAWTPAHGLPARPGRLHLRPEPDDAVILEILQRIFVDVMDQGIRQDVDRLGVERAAEEELAFFRWLPGPRTWWRVAHTSTGELAGLTIPSRNYGGPQIGFVGVLPGQRGHGYGYELLAESIHLLADAGANRITATTDTTNTPMVAGFARAGYPITRHRILLTHRWASRPPRD